MVAKRGSGELVKVKVNEAKSTILPIIRILPTSETTGVWCFRIWCFRSLKFETC